MTKKQINQKPARVTIRDVAREAGVALSTASNALTRKDCVLPKTRNKVLRAAEKLGYRASVVAQAMRSRRTMAIGVLVADVANPSYPDFVRGIEDVAVREGCTLLLCNTDGDEERQIQQMRSLIDRQVDGMVLLSPHCDSKRVRDLLGMGVPYVLVQRRSSRFDDNYVGGDNADGIRTAVAHLVELGHSRIGYVCGPPESSSVRERLAAYKLAVQDLGADSDSQLIRQSDYSTAGGNAACRHYLAMENPPTAIVASSDMNALGILDAADELGVSVPEQLSVVGYDDISLARLKRISLTTIHLPQRELGAAAAELLMELVTKGNTSKLARRIIFPTGLVERGSTAAAPN